MINELLVTSIVIITLALIFYSIGTWGERIQRKLKLWHIIFFFLGLIADASGTAMMSKIAEGRPSDPLHEITGMLAILLMGIHALWALITYFKGTDKAKENFSKFSIVVWAFWLIPYFIGLFIGMQH